METYDEEQGHKIRTPFGVVRLVGQSKAVEEIERIYVTALLGGLSIKKQITQLIEDDFFSIPRTVNEVFGELRNRSFSCDKNSLGPILYLEFYKNGPLSRSGQKRKFQYFLSPDFPEMQ